MPRTGRDKTPLQWGRRFLLALLVLGGAADAQPPRIATDGFGLAVWQNGAPVPLADFGLHDQAELEAAPFELRSDVTADGGTVMLAIGLGPEVYDRFGSRTDPIFGPASGYAREEKPGATLFLTDPACRVASDTGFNFLGPEHSENGAWPVLGIEPDRSSDDCAIPSVPPRANLIEGGRTLYLVISDGEGADFLTLVFRDAPRS